MRLIVGLGNPGEKYKNTRHNAGFIVIENLKLKISDFSEWKFDKKFNAEVAMGNVSHNKIIFAKPRTFMNKSGEAVAAAANFYKIKPEDILVIHDDIDLPLGKIRIKKDGRSGGHQGVQSIIDLLGTQNFSRLKIGVSPAVRPKGFDAAKFVLRKFAKSEEKIIFEAIKKATEAVAVILAEGIEKSMSQFN